MQNSIRNFNKQFSYKPVVENPEGLKQGSGVIVVGVGGSALAPMILKAWKPELDIVIHKDYGLPAMPGKALREKLVILSSYSGNTEEVIEAFNQAKEKNLKMAVIAMGGRLLALAKENNIPYIAIPDTGIQPRSALGFSTKALMKIMGEEDELRKLGELTETLDITLYEEAGKALAGRVKGRVPVVYSSTENLALAYNWKIKLNETGKIPAFYNTFPELNHNEMTGYDVKDPTRELNNFHFIILRDGSPRILKRMDALEKMYKDLNFPVEMVAVEGKDFWHKTFSSLILADWFAYYTAMEYGLEAKEVPMVETFKKLIS